MKKKNTTDERVLADKIVQTVGSWRFITIQTFILAIWMALNTIGHVYHWDQYPFVFMNLMLSMQAAYAAPFILMSQNRQSASDRRDARVAYDLTQQTESNVRHIADDIKDLADTLDDIEDSIDEEDKQDKDDLVGLA